MHRRPRETRVGVERWALKEKGFCAGQSMGSIGMSFDRAGLIGEKWRGEGGLRSFCGGREPEMEAFGQLTAHSEVPARDNVSAGSDRAWMGYIWRVPMCLV